MLRGKKLGGILLERSGDRVVVGFGINLASAPEGIEREVAMLGSTLAPQAFAPLLAASLARLLQRWRTNESSALVRAWQERAHLPGTRLTVHVAKDEAISGRFGGLDADGALRLIRDDGSIEAIRAGDVEL
jgi:BirA family biotin operon repressor/biotin-[acetyl-CoA-carboxylase] ligase